MSFYFLLSAFVVKNMQSNHNQKLRQLFRVFPRVSFIFKLYIV